MQQAVLRNLRDMHAVWLPISSNIQKNLKQFTAHFNLNYVPSRNEKQYGCNMTAQKVIKTVTNSFR
jgi:hypothetical protein